MFLNFTTNSSFCHLLVFLSPFEVVPELMLLMLKVIEFVLSICLLRFQKLLLVCFLFSANKVLEILALVTSIDVLTAGNICFFVFQSFWGTLHSYIHFLGFIKSYLQSIEETLDAWLTFSCLISSYYIKISSCWFFFIFYSFFKQF